MASDDKLEDFFDRDVYDRCGEKAPYELASNALEGRFLAASRDIEAGEVIFKEEALFWSPRYSTKPICLVCYGYLYSVDYCYPCKCGWPLCSEKCLSSADTSDHALECSVYSSSSSVKIDFTDFNYEGVENAYDVIGPIRIIAEKNSSKWNTFWKLMSHIEDWKNTPGWTEHHQREVDVLKTIFPEMDSDTILKIFGIFYTNDFSIRISGAADSQGKPILCPKIRQLYALTSLLSHDCMPNALKIVHASVENKFRIDLIAKENIKKGDKITGAYVDTFAPTLIRKKVLKESKLFDCNCKRCLKVIDGVGGSTLICSKCHKYVDCAPNLEFDCKSCGEIMREGPDIVKRIHSEMEDLLNDPDRCTVEEYERFILKHKTILHPNHLIFARLKYSLAGFYGRLHGYEMHVMTPKMLKRKWEVSEDVLRVLEDIDPGISIYKGMVHYELHMPMIMLTQMEHQTGELNLEKTKDVFYKALNHLKTSLEHLQYESFESFEGQVYSGALFSIEPLKQFVKDM